MLLQFFVFPSDHNYVYVHTEQLFSISIIIYMYQSCSFRNAARVRYRTHGLCDACESHLAWCGSNVNLRKLIHICMEN